MAAHSQQSAISDTLLVAKSALSVAVRDRTVVWLSILFMAMVFISAYLGWSATHTLDLIYQKAVPVLQGLGQAVPVNPATEVSALSDLRNMTTYVSLLGALAAVVFGNQLVSIDRKSGVVPLIASRTVARTSYAAGKIAALIAAVIGVMLLAALINIVTVLLLPGQGLTGPAWAGLAAFYGVSCLYLTVFGLMGAYFASATRSESMALLIPVTIWLVLTFVLPQLTSNINPMAALNPVKATIAPLTGSFFDVMASIIGPVSLAEVYRGLASTILGFAPAGAAPRTMSAGIAILTIAIFLLSFAFIRSIWTFDASRSDYND